MKISKIICMLIICTSAFSAVQANRGQKQKRGHNKYEALRNKSCEHFLLDNNQIVLVCKGELKKSSSKARNLTISTSQDVIDFMQGSEVEDKKIILDDVMAPNNPNNSEDEDEDLAGGPWSGTGSGGMV